MEKRVKESNECFKIAEDFIRSGDNMNAVKNLVQAYRLLQHAYISLSQRADGVKKFCDDMIKTVEENEEYFLDDFDCDMKVAFRDIRNHLELK